MMFREDSDDAHEQSRLPDAAQIVKDENEMFLEKVKNSGGLGSDTAKRVYTGFFGTDTQTSA